MTAKQRREYWLKVERMRLKLERKYTPLVREALDNQASSFKEAYAKNPQAAMSEMNMQLWNEELLKVFYALYKETYPLFASATFTTVKKEALKFQTMGVSEIWTQEVVDWLSKYGLQLVFTISGNSRDLYLAIVNKAIQEGVEQGLSVDQVTALIVKRLGDEGYTFTRFRAERITRTETIRAANEGHMAGARTLPFEVKKVWVAAKDDRTRRVPNDQFDHWNLDGDEAEMWQDFTSVSKNGVQVNASQPGDVRAPAGFTINCRCRVTFRPKRDKNGRLIMKNGN